MEVSVITIAKQHEPGLNATYQSLEMQSFRDWELLIVVGLSEDGTLSAAKTIQARDSRVHVIEQQGLGIYSAMNTGLTASNGEFVWFMNAGDKFASPSVLSHGISAIRSSDVGMVIGGYQVDAQTGPKVYRFWDGVVSAHRFAFNRRWGCHQAMIFRTQQLKLIGGFNQSYSLASDFDLVLKVIKKWKAKRVAEVYAIVEPGGSADQNIFLVHKQKHEIRQDLLGGPVIFSYSLFWSALAKLWINMRRILKIHHKF